MNQEKSDPTSERDAHEEEHKRQFFAGNKLSFAQAFWVKPDSSRDAQQQNLKKPIFKILARNLSS